MLKKDSLKIQQHFLNSGTQIELLQKEMINLVQIGNEALESPTSSFQNSLSTIIPWKEKMVNFKSYISYQNDKQTLEISPASYLQFPYKEKDENEVKNMKFKPGTNALQI
jgi:hypothetical protein